MKYLQVKENAEDLDLTQWLTSHLEPLANTPDDEFIELTAEDIKANARQK